MTKPPQMISSPGLPPARGRGILRPMPSPYRKRVTLEDVPADLVKALNAEHKRSKHSINDIVCNTLAERYALPYGRVVAHRFRPLNHPRVILNVPDDIWRAVRRHAFESEGTQRGVILYALSQHYGLPPVHMGKREKAA